MRMRQQIIKRIFARKRSPSVGNLGFTVVEVMIALGMLSFIMLAITEITVSSSKTNQSAAAEAELSSDISLLINLINSTTPASANGLSGCSLAFQSMALDPTTITPLTPVPVPLGEIDMTYGSGNAVIKITPVAQATSNLQIQSLNFVQVVDQGFQTPPLIFAGSTAYLIKLEITAQKTPGFNSKTITGGLTTYTKDILLPLWINANVIQGCISG